MVELCVCGRTINYEKAEMTQLESAVAIAAKDPATRPEFYRILLASEIYVLGSSDMPDDGCHSLPAGSSLSLVTWKKADGTTVVPFFASLEALRRLLKEPTPYVTMPARAFFEMTKGATLVLNPSSEYEKEFLPHEIDALLQTGVNSLLTLDQVQEPRKVLLGQPADYPAAMVAALSKLLAKHPTVKGAYLCIMHDPSAGNKPALVVGLEGQGDLVLAIREVGSVAAETAPEGQPVHIVEIKRGQSGIDDYLFASGRRFYSAVQEDGRRAWLRSRAGVGFTATALVLGVCRNAVPQVPGFIAWPLILCTLTIYVWLATGGKKFLPDGRRRASPPS